MSIDDNLTKFERQVERAVITLEADQQGCLHWTCGDWFADCAFCVAYDRMNARDQRDSE